MSAAKRSPSRSAKTPGPAGRRPSSMSTASPAPWASSAPEEPDRSKRLFNEGRIDQHAKIEKISLRGGEDARTPEGEEQGTEAGGAVGEAPRGRQVPDEGENGQAGSAEGADPERELQQAGAGVLQEDHPGEEEGNSRGA